MFSSSNISSKMADVASTSASPAEAATTKPHTLLTLPLEIRNRIYEFVFDEAELKVIGPSGVMINGTLPGVSYHNAHRSSLLVCKQIRQEVKPVLLSQTVVVIQDGCNSKLKQVWRVDVDGTTPPTHASASLVGWMPPGQVEAYSKATIVRLRISTTGGKCRYNWQWFPLKHFDSLQVLEIKKDGGSSIMGLRKDEGGLDDPPDLEKAAACKDKTLFQLAEERAYGSIGGRDKLVETLNIPPSVELRTSVMVKIYSSKGFMESEFVGRWIIQVEKRTLQKSVHSRRADIQHQFEGDPMDW